MMKAGYLSKLRFYSCIF